MDQRSKLQTLSDEYQNLQTELSTLVSARQKLESQQQENKSVQNVRVTPSLPPKAAFQLTDEKEFNGLDDDASIYKLVGPVLLKQDTTEAKSTVEGRLDFIEKEIKRIEASIKKIQEKSEGARMEIMQIQAQMQESAPQA